VNSKIGYLVALAFRLQLAILKESGFVSGVTRT